MSREDPDVIDSVARALALLESFSADHSTMTVSEAAVQTGLTRATARRILLTLVRQGFARQESRGFRLTPRVLRLGYAYLSSLPVTDIAQPHMRALADQLQESCSMATLDGDEIVYLVRVPASRSMSITLGVGARLPAYPTSMGRVLLAAMSTDEFDRYVERTTLDRLTAHTIVDEAEFRSVISGVRESSLAVVDQEREEGVRSAACPVRDTSGRVVAALNVSVHAGRVDLDRLNNEFIPHLRQAAAAISTDLGHSR